MPTGGGAAVELELEIRVGTPVGTTCSLIEARRTIAALTAALEIVGYAGVVPSLAAVVEGSSLRDGTVLGRAPDPSRAPVVGPGSPRLLHNGTGTGVANAARLPSDLGEIVVLAARFLGRYSRWLEALDWILSGAFNAPVGVRSGDEVAADFGPLGSVGLRLQGSAWRRTVRHASDARVDRLEDLRAEIRRLEERSNASGASALAARAPGSASTKNPPEFLRTRRVETISSASGRGTSASAPCSCAASSAC